MPGGYLLEMASSQYQVHGISSDRERIITGFFSKYRLKSQQKTLEHTFLTGEYAAGIWITFSDAAGIHGLFVQVKQAVKKWWDAKCSVKLKPLYQAAPPIILWQLWKRKNTFLHGGTMSKYKVLYDINLNLVQLARTKHPWMKNLSNSWPHLVQQPEDYRPQMIFTLVQWTSPPQGWFKCNSDGASKGNPGPSSSAYCVRDSVGESINANARTIANTHCLVAEAKAMYNGRVYCVNNQLIPLFVETDSLTLVKIVEGTINYNNFQELPVAAKKLVNIDKMHIPSFRFKTNAVNNCNNLKRKEEYKRVSNNRYKKFRIEDQ
ncbi:uncharacterized protein LOC132048805 [Lycium ferocissimum]|uniref:uncharacterized protein LOC132048805 n=1 Tax=Lycium ferocissimum TaxID=112874 RepID=UPI002815A64B|nr:uncharacterized protein LOC132048805 [Lycium ferocissimum]